MEAESANPTRDASPRGTLRPGYSTVAVQADASGVSILITGGVGELAPKASGVLPTGTTCRRPRRISATGAASSSPHRMAPSSTQAVPTSSPSAYPSTAGRWRASGRSGPRTSSLIRPAGASPIASTRATRTSCRLEHRESRFASACSSTASLQAHHTASTSTPSRSWHEITAEAQRTTAARCRREFASILARWPDHVRGGRIGAAIRHRRSASAQSRGQRSQFCGYRLRRRTCLNRPLRLGFGVWIARLLILHTREVAGSKPAAPTL